MFPPFVWFNIVVNAKKRGRKRGKPYKAVSGIAACAFQWKTRKNREEMFKSSIQKNKPH